MKRLLISNNPKTILFCCGCLSALAMAPVYFWPLIITGYSVLLYTLVTLQREARQNALLAFVFFFGYFLTGLYWTSSSLFIDFDRWWWALPFSFAGLPFLLALFPTILVYGASYIPACTITRFILALILADFLRSFIFTGFPWNMPAHAMVNVDAVMALLPNIGFHVFNALIIFICCIPAIILIRAKMHAKPLVYSALLSLFLCLLLVVNFIKPQKEVSNTAPENVIMVQANIPQHEKWDRDLKRRNLNRYIAMSRASLKKNNEPVVVIWPETAISQSMLSNPTMRAEFYSFLNSLPEGSHLITGYLYATQEGHFNALAVLNRNGDIIDLYNKHHLVPFGEYMPFGLDTLTGVSNFRSGQNPRPISLPDSEDSFLPLICYEIIFSTYSLAATKGGVIINITNDAWFGNTAGPHQHFDHAVFRAKENNAIVLRLSGNGLSGIIAPSGHIHARTILNKKAVISNY